MLPPPTRKRRQSAPKETQVSSRKKDEGKSSSDDDGPVLWSPGRKRRQSTQSLAKRQGGAPSIPEEPQEPVNKKARSTPPSKFKTLRRPSPPKELKKATEKKKSKSYGTMKNIDLSSLTEKQDPTR